MTHSRNLAGMFSTAFVLPALLATMLISSTVAEEPAKVTHSFLACGSNTRIVGDDGQVTWSYPHSSRDGYVLADGRIILTLSKSEKYPGGAVVEINPHADPQEEHLIYKGAQSEVNSAQPVDGDRFVLTEAGPNPRLLEVDRDGKIHVEFPLACQKQNHHLQARMARKLADGTYLVPQLLDFAIKQYNADGEVVKEFDTTVDGDPDRNFHTWPFTAIRLADGSTVANLTHGSRSVRFDAAGKVIWQLTNDDLPGPWLADPCGAQVLPNGNIVIATYGQRDAKLPKLFEVTPDKEVVWTHYDKIPNSAHHFQILTTNCQPLDGPVNK